MPAVAVAAPVRGPGAVLVPESTIGRYRVALEELSRYAPLLVVYLRSWRGSQEIVLVPELVVRNDRRRVSGTPLAATTGEARTAEDWQQVLSEEAYIPSGAAGGLHMQGRTPRHEMLKSIRPCDMVSPKPG